MSNPGQFSLLRERRFAPFFATQFLGALNDNVLKNAPFIAVAVGGPLDPDGASPERLHDIVRDLRGERR